MNEHVNKQQVEPAEAVAIRRAAMLGDFMEMVERFNREVIGLPIPDAPTPITGDRKKHCVEHLIEEVNEFATSDDVEKQADAMVDLCYVALGRLVEMGVCPRPVFEEVHAANMRKVRGQVAKRPSSKGHDAVKPDGWRGPDLRRMLSITKQDVDTLPSVLVEVARLRARKGADYNDNGVQLQDYFPLGAASYFQMMHVKHLRAKSMINLRRKDGTPRNESLRDTLLDIINYASFWVEAMDRGEV